IDGTPVLPPLDPSTAAELRSQIKPPPLLERRAGRVSAFAAAGVLVLAGFALLLVERGGKSHAAPAPLDRLVRVDPETGRILAQLPLGGKPAAVATGAGAVWVVDATHDTLLRVDPQTDRIVAHINVGTKPSS